MEAVACNATASLRLLIITFFLFFSLSSSTAVASPLRLRRRPEPCNTMTLYYHDIRYAGNNIHNATSVLVGSAAYHSDRTLLGPVNHFGDTVVFNDTLTAGPELGSPAVGRAEGLYIYSGKDALGAWFVWTFTLDHTNYGGGSLSIVGHDVIVPTRHMPIVGGTGDFFLTRGIVHVHTDAIEYPTYFRLKLDVELYECYHSY